MAGSEKGGAARRVGQLGSAMVTRAQHAGTLLYLLPAGQWQTVLWEGREEELGRGQGSKEDRAVLGGAEVGL